MTKVIEVYSIHRGRLGSIDALAKPPVHVCWRISSLGVTELIHQANRWDRDDKCDNSVKLGPERQTWCTVIQQLMVHLSVDWFAAQMTTKELGNRAYLR